MVDWEKERVVIRLAAGILEMRGLQIEVGDGQESGEQY
jgi:hypothetical protein